MDASLMARLNQLEHENRQLKKMYVEERLKAVVIKDAMEKKWSAHVSDVSWLSTLWHAIKSVSVKRVVGLA